jgi:spermidine/putrescine transport system substrate-binding protein
VIFWALIRRVELKKYLAVTAFVLLGASTANLKAETLNLLIWEKYISPKILERWTAETGIGVREIFFDNGDDRDRILADPNSDVDLAILNENVTSLYSRNGKLMEVSDQTVPSAKNSIPRWRERCAGYALPYFWGTLGIVYRSDKVTVPPTSWDDLLKPNKELYGHIAMQTGYDDLLTPALIMTGSTVSAENASELKKAFEVLKAQAPAVKTYDYVITSAQNATYGKDIHMALAYSGDQFVLSDTTSLPWKYVLPKEGSVLWVDCLAANANSKRRDSAMRFLNFINQPDVAAENSIYLSLPTTNAAAIPLLPEKMRNDPQIFPPEDVVEASQFYLEYPAAVVQLRKRIVSTVTGIHDAQ